MIRFHWRRLAVVTLGLITLDVGLLALLFPLLGIWAGALVAGLAVPGVGLVMDAIHARWPLYHRDG